MAATSTRMGGGRSPPFIIIGLSIAFCILAFNYWSLSTENSTLVEEFKTANSAISASRSKQVVAEKRSESITAQLEQCKAAGIAKDEDHKASYAEKDKKLEDAVAGEATCKKGAQTAETNMAGVQTELKQVKEELTTAQGKVQACFTKECEPLRKEIVTNFLDIVDKTLGKDAVESLGKAGISSLENPPKPDAPVAADKPAEDKPAAPDQQAAQNPPPVADKPDTK